MFWVLFTMTLFVIDMMVKDYVREHFDEHTDKPLKGTGDRVHLQKFYNEGAAMGILKNHKLLLKVITLSGIGCFLMMLPAILKKGSNSLKLAVSLILAGGVNNAYERLVRNHVTDYINFPKMPGKIKNIVFNLSDFFIMAGAVLFVLRRKK